MIANRNSCSLKFRFLVYLLSLPLAGCSRAPSLDLLGSFFPAWLICFAAAVVLTALTRLALLRFQMRLDLPLLAYPSLTTFLTLALWLVFFA
jgi:hypothetical protein